MTKTLQNKSVTGRNQRIPCDAGCGHRLSRSGHWDGSLGQFHSWKLSLLLVAVWESSTRGAVMGGVPKGRELHSTNGSIRLPLAGAGLGVLPTGILISSWLLKVGESVCQSGIEFAAHGRVEKLQQNKGKIRCFPVWEAGRWGRRQQEPLQSPAWGVKWQSFILEPRAGGEAPV